MTTYRVTYPVTVDITAEELNAFAAMAASTTPPGETVTFRVETIKEEPTP